MNKYLNHYYKDLKTGAEFNFIFLEEWGWSVACINKEAMRQKGELPWPDIDEEDQKRIDKNYEDLNRDLDYE